MLGCLAPIGRSQTVKQGVDVLANLIYICRLDRSSLVPVTSTSMSRTGNLRKILHATADPTRLPKANPRKLPSENHAPPTATDVSTITDMVHCVARLSRELSSTAECSERARRDCESNEGNADHDEEILGSNLS